MILPIDSKFLIKSSDEIDIRPEDFLSCATISELYEEVYRKIEDSITFPDIKSKFFDIELLGFDLTPLTYSIINNKSFLDEWQRLKNLPEEL